MCSFEEHHRKGTPGLGVRTWDQRLEGFVLGGFRVQGLQFRVSGFGDLELVGFCWT